MDLDLKEGAPSESVGVVDVVLASVVAGAAAWAIHALMLRLRWARFWPFAGSTALALSMSGPSWAADGEAALDRRRERGRSRRAMTRAPRAL
jgi:hypothetical protein